MTLREYNKVHGFKATKNQGSDALGYLVKGVNENNSTYSAWVSKEQFEANSIECDDVDGLRPFELIIVAERSVLNHRLNKLINFTRRPNFLAIEHGAREILIAQTRAMQQYLNKLDKRISLFTPNH